MKVENGFTLVELLVAMVAGSLLLISLTWMLGSVTQLFQKQPSDQQSAQVADLAPALDALIGQIAPPDKDTGPVTVTNDALQFVSAPPLAAGQSRRMDVLLKSEQRADGVALVGRFEGIVGERPWVRQTVLAHGFKAISFAAHWPSDPNAVKLPRLLTIAFVEPDGETARIVAAPRLTGGGACHFDPISMTCRR